MPNQAADDFGDSAQEGHVVAIKVSLAKMLPEGDGRAHQQDGDSGPLTGPDKALPQNLVQQLCKDLGGGALETGLPLSCPGQHAGRQRCMG